MWWGPKRFLPFLSKLPFRQRVGPKTGEDWWVGVSWHDMEDPIGRSSMNGCQVASLAPTSTPSYEEWKIPRFSISMSPSHPLTRSSIFTLFSSIGSLKTSWWKIHAGQQHKEYNKQRNGKNSNNNSNKKRFLLAAMVL